MQSKDFSGGKTSLDALSFSPAGFALQQSVSQALIHKFPGINTYLPQNRHLPALKPYLLGRDNVFNAVWQTQSRYNSRQGISPANCAVVPKKTHVPVSIHSTLTPAVPVVQRAAPMLAIYC